MVEITLEQIDAPALYDAMDILAYFQDEGWDQGRIINACRLIVEVGDAVDAHAEKLHELRMIEAAVKK